MIASLAQLFDAQMSQNIISADITVRAIPNIGTADAGNPRDRGLSKNAPQAKPKILAPTTVEVVARTLP